MDSLQPPAPFANTDDVTLAAARDSLERWGAALVARSAGLGLATDLAALCRSDPLRAEAAFRDTLFGMARTVLSDAFGAPDGHGPSLEVDGRTYRRAEATRGRAMTVFGPVGFLRSRYRPSGAGASVVPAEAVPGLTAGGMTPMAAGLSMFLMSGLTARESGDAWKRLCGAGPSTASLVRLSAEAGSCVEACSGELLDGLREGEELPEGAASVLVSPDGVMMRMNAGAADGGEVREAGWREASCGVVALLDADGEVLESRHFGRLPERGRAGLKSRLEAEALHWLRLDPDLGPVAVADGAGDSWPFLDSLCPDVTLVDFFHSVQHLGAAADAAFGPDTDAGRVWSERWRHVLRHDAKGVGRVIDALRYLLRKGRGASVIRTELGYFRGNRSRMNYAEAADAGHPVGSGIVESANKVLVTARMKRSGQSWSRDGGQGVLTFRSLLKSGRFDRAWAAIPPQLSRSGWRPPQPANDSTPARQVAPAA